MLLKLLSSVNIVSSNLLRTSNCSTVINSGIRITTNTLRHVSVMKDTKISGDKTSLEVENEVQEDFITIYS